jgi:hypothetical protein
LESAHGTYLNRKRVPSRKYILVRVGDQLKFGESTRTYILEGEEAEEPVQMPKPKHEKTMYTQPPQVESSGVTWYVFDGTFGA